MSNYTALARSWRPNILSDVIGQELTVSALSNALTHNVLHHAYLFTGTRGVGKTSLARILAKSMNCEEGISPNACMQCNSCIGITAGKAIDVLEIDAASKTKVEDTRELLEQTQYAPVNGRFKIFIIDEVHMLSGHSFNALLKTLEEPPQHVKFLLATTELAKVPPTIRSRCIHFPLQNIQAQTIVNYIKAQLKSQTIKCDDSALSIIAQHAKGSLRDALTLLEHALMIDQKTLTLDTVTNLTGQIPLAYLSDLLKAMYQGKNALLEKFFNDFKSKATNYNSVLEQLINLTHQETMKPLYNTQSEYDDEFLQIAYDVLLQALSQASYAPSEQINFEMAVMRVAFFCPAIQQVTQSPPTVTVDNKPQDSLTHTTWLSIIPDLELSGMGLALAKELVIIEQNNTSLLCELAPNMKSLVQDSSQKAIVTALQKRNFNIQTIEIKLNNHQLNTYTQMVQSEKANYKQSVTNALSEHPQSNSLLETLKADLARLEIETTSP